MMIIYGAYSEFIYLPRKIGFTYNDILQIAQRNVFKVVYTRNRKILSFIVSFLTVWACIGPLGGSLVG